MFVRIIQTVVGGESRGPCARADFRELAGRTPPAYSCAVYTRHVWTFPPTDVYNISVYQI